MRDRPTWWRLRELLNERPVSLRCGPTFSLWKVSAGAAAASANAGATLQRTTENLVSASTGCPVRSLVATGRLRPFRLRLVEFDGLFVGVYPQGLDLR